ncbi:rhodanese-like domain-containing protein [Granulosicoccus antarcticus]|uniref:tRNA uridine(34) hydroxylase n=1 Tax=Granulosicoccus antarcticus IMCC3135 TaxID=1192854 RepID=A0A2Z2NX95_9GAMM|nr:rhodanese-like domain-containing protein [Granulosicoccus antarcticus]ASJ75969.1 putative adenylyltransferase/sulfurtransferase MoeZ [Granulosicoccus antarcticus IMCC3135]
MQASDQFTADTSPDTTVGTEYINLSGYRFLPLDYLPLLQADLHASLAETGVLGTILLADEGINVALAGTAAQCQAARTVFDNDERFRELWLKESVSELIPFSKLKVRIRHEIIAFDGPEARTRQLERPTAPALPPEELAQWLDSGKDFTLLDTRNTYEVESGTFQQAEHLDIAHFRDYQKAIKTALESGTLDPKKPIVTFCTGGIRCEKAAPWMIEQGFKEVYQIEGGVLNYFEKTGGKHWEGDCFVFDDRVEVDKALQPTGATWCTECQLTISPGKQCSCQSSRTAMEMV